MAVDGRVGVAMGGLRGLQTYLHKGLHASYLASGSLQQDAVGLAVVEWWHRYAHFRELLLEFPESVTIGANHETPLLWLHSHLCLYHLCLLERHLEAGPRCHQPGEETPRTVMVLVRASSCGGTITCTPAYSCCSCRNVVPRGSTIQRRT